MTDTSMARLIAQAIREVASDYRCNGNHDSDLIADAFNSLADKIDETVKVITIHDQFKP